MIANGQLKHHFWGEYSATIGLVFASAIDADAARERLAHFEVSPKRPEVLVFHGSGDTLRRVEDTLVAYGADRRKIGSLRYSIDYGEPFTIDVPPAALETQLALDLASDQG